MAKSKGTTDVVPVTNSLSEIVNEESVIVEPNTTLVFKTNFSELEAKLKKALAKYKGIKVTDSNFEQCKFIQKECASLRILLENKRKEAIKMYIELPKNKLNAEFEAFMKLIAEVEDSLKEQFDVYDQERREQLTVIYNGYITEFAEKYSVRDEFVAKVELKKQYFNKTAKESDVIKDIEQQVLECKKAQDEYDAAVALIEKECLSDARLNPKLWISQLQYRALPAVITALQEEKARLLELDSGISTSKSTDEEVDNVGGGDARDEKVISVVVRLTYPESVREVLQSFFKQHREIKVELISKE